MTYQTLLIRLWSSLIHLRRYSQIYASTCSSDPFTAIVSFLGSWKTLSIFFTSISSWCMTIGILIFRYSCRSTRSPWYRTWTALQSSVINCLDNSIINSSVFILNEEVSTWCLGPWRGCGLITECFKLTLSACCKGLCNRCWNFESPFWEQGFLTKHINVFDISLDIIFTSCSMNWSSSNWCLTSVSSILNLCIRIYISCFLTLNSLRCFLHPYTLAIPTF